MMSGWSDAGLSWRWAVMLAWRTNERQRKSKISSFQPSECGKLHLILTCLCVWMCLDAAKAKWFLIWSFHLEPFPLRVSLVLVDAVCSGTGWLVCVLVSDTSSPAGINQRRWTWATSNWRLPKRPWWTNWQRMLTTSGPETAYGRAGPTAYSRSVCVIQRRLFQNVHCMIELF